MLLECRIVIHIISEQCGGIADQVVQWCRGATAEDYHAFSEFTASYGRVALQAVAPCAGELLLDDACGPGHIALEAAKQYNIKVDATDFSTSMIEAARKGLDADGAKTDVTFHIMDGQNLDFPADRFDVVFSCFGVFLFPDPVQGLREMWRVAKRGGRMVVVSWTTRERGVLGPWYKYCEAHAPELLQTLPKMPNPGVMDSVANMEAALRDASSQDAAAIECTRSMPLDAPEKWIGVMLNNPFLSELKQAISEEQKGELARFLGETCRGSNGGVVVTGTAVIGVVNGSAEALREAVAS